ncbi:hypothetical protein [Slackia exigua]|uniref:hypothetical protein n=1 Tax=Slackia exigua TaxID=84109 RepID=UPI0028DC0CE6|nr:hypothetical protein [Slackia exigua]
MAVAVHADSHIGLVVHADSRIGLDHSNLDAARRRSFESYGFARVLAFDCHGFIL